MKDHELTNAFIVMVIVSKDMILKS